MDVRLQHTDVRTDEDIARAARTLLHWTVGLKREAVLAGLREGIVCVPL